MDGTFINRARVGGGSATYICTHMHIRRCKDKKKEEGGGGTGGGHIALRVVSDLHYSVLSRSRRATLTKHCGVHQSLIETALWRGGNIKITN